MQKHTLFPLMFFLACTGIFAQNVNLDQAVQISAQAVETRLEKMRKYADLRGDSEPKVRRHFLGTVAGIVVEDDEREYALSQGFFLIKPTGENFIITTPYNKLKEW